MASLTIRNIPEEVMKRLRQAATEEHRSINSQAVQWLEQGAGQWMSPRGRAKLVRDIQSLREAIARRHGPGSDSTEIIRRMRMERAKARS